MQQAVRYFSFDALAYSNLFQSAGIPKPHADIIVTAIKEQAETQHHVWQEIVMHDLASKDHLREVELGLKADIDKTRLALEANIRETELALKADIRETELALKADIRETELALKADIRKVEVNLREVEMRLKADIEKTELKMQCAIQKSKVDIIKWVVALLIVHLGTMAAIMAKGFGWLGF